jgi:anti-sigma factor RsiW
MTTPEAPLGEYELNAYVDGQLGPERRAAIERFLAVNSDASRRVAADAAHRDALRVAFADQMTKPLPPGLDLSGLLEQRLRRRPISWQIAAAVVLSLGVGAAAGWLLRAPAMPDRAERAMALLRSEALASHTVYGTDPRHPVEVSASERDHLAQWLSNRLRRSITPPDLTSFGYNLMGGRLLATEQGNPAALFMYEDGSGNRVSLTMRPMAADLHVPIVDWKHENVNACAWIEGGIGYALLGKVSDDELDRIARNINTRTG